MKNGWKWLLIIVLVFIVAFVLSAGIFFMLGYGRLAGINSGYTVQSWRLPWMMRHGPMMGGYRIMWRGLGWRLLLGTGIIVLIVWGIMSLTGKSKSKNRVQQSTSVPTSAPTSVVSPAPEPSVSAARCVNCGRDLQPDWLVCPYCGTKVAPETKDKSD